MKMQISIILLFIFILVCVNGAEKCNEELYSHLNQSPQTFGPSFSADSDRRENLHAWNRKVEANLKENSKIPPVTCIPVGGKETSVLRVAMVHMSMIGSVAREENRFPDGVVKKITPEMVIDGLTTDINHMNAHVLTFLDFPMTKGHALAESFRQKLQSRGYKHQLVASNQTGIVGTFVASRLAFRSSATVDIGGDEDMVELVLDKNEIKEEREDAMRRERLLYLYVLQLNRTNKTIRESQMNRALDRIQFDSHNKAGHLLVLGEFSEPATSISTESFIQDGHLREAWRALNWSPPHYTSAVGSVTDLALIGETESHELRGAYQFHTSSATHTHLIIDLWAGKGTTVADDENEGATASLNSSSKSSFFGGKSGGKWTDWLWIVLGVLGLLLLLLGILVAIIVGNGRRLRRKRSEANTKGFWPWSKGRSDGELEAGYMDDDGGDKEHELELPDPPSQATSPVHMSKFESIQLATNTDLHSNRDQSSGSGLATIREEGSMKDFDNGNPPYMTQVGSSFSKPVKTPRPRGGPGRKDDSYEQASNDEAEEDPKDEPASQAPQELQFTVRKKAKRNSKNR